MSSGRASSRSLLLGDRSDDQPAPATSGHRCPGLDQSCPNERLHLRQVQDRRRRNPDEAILAAAAEQKIVRVGQGRAVVERQPDSVCGRRDRHHAIGRPLRRTVPNHKEVVVVVHQLVGRRHQPAERPPRRADHSLILVVELFDECFQLFLRRSGSGRPRSAFHRILEVESQKRCDENLRQHSALRHRQPRTKKRADRRGEEDHPRPALFSRVESG